MVVTAPTHAPRDIECTLEELDSEAFAPRIKDARLSYLLLYWCTRRAAGVPTLIPGRADFDPLKLGRLLPSLLLGDVVGAEWRLRYRLVGTGIVDRLGTDLTGQYLDEVVGTGPLLDLAVTLYHVAISRQCPVYCETRLRPDGQIGLMTNCRLLLPLAADGRNVDMVLAGHADLKHAQSRGAPTLIWNGFPETSVSINVAP